MASSAKVWIKHYFCIDRRKLNREILQLVDVGEGVANESEEGAAGGFMAADADEKFCGWWGRI
jgi:hypothetical protein